MRELALFHWSALSSAAAPLCFSFQLLNLIYAHPNLAVAYCAWNLYRTKLMTDIRNGFSLGAYQVRPNLGELEGADGICKLQPRVMDVLVCLASANGNAVSREALLRTVWGDVVVGDDSIHRCISALRVAFGDSSRDSKYIQTVHRRGYRLLQPVRAIGTKTLLLPADRMPRYSVLFICIVIGFLLAVTFSSRKTDVTEGSHGTAAHVLIADIISHANNEPLARALRTATSVGVAQLPWPTVLPDSEIHTTLLRMTLPTDTLIDTKLAREIAIRQGADAIVVGSLTELVDGFVLSIQLIEPHSGGVLFSTSVPVEEAGQLIQALDAISQKLAAKISQRTVDDRVPWKSLPNVTTNNLDALIAYSTAIGAWSQAKPQQALTLLEEAITLDPEFALAHAKTASILSSLETERGRMNESLSIATSLEHRLSQRERLYVQGIAARALAPAEQLKPWLLLTKLYPNDATGHGNLGQVQWYHYNDFDRALASFEHSFNVARDQKPVALFMSAYALLGQSKLDKAIATFEASGITLNSGLADAYTATARFEEAAGYLDTATLGAERELAWWANRRRIGLYIAQGRFTQALHHIELLLDSQIASNRPNDVLAIEASRLFVYDQQQNPATIEFLSSLVQRELDMLRADNYRDSAQPVMRLSLLGKVAARNGAQELAEAILDRVATLADNQNGFPLWLPTVSNLRGEIELAAGNLEQAIDLLEASARASDLMQHHESLATAYLRAGRSDEALFEFLWIIQNNGRAYAEWYDDFYAKSQNIIDVSEARLAAAELMIDLGRHGGASGLLAEFSIRWSEADAELKMVSRFKQLSAKLDLLH